jgi:adenylate cyclase
MMAPPDLPDEAQRLAALHATGLLDTDPEERFDAITRLLAHVLDAPMALVTLVDSDRQWFKSRVGLPYAQSPRSTSFCAHAIATDDLFVVADAANDARFQDNPAVVGDPNVRFYAGRPLHGPGGHRIGTLCAIDTRPRQLDARGRAAIEDLAQLVERELLLTDVANLQRKVIDVQAENEKLLMSILPRSVARELREGRGMVAHAMPDATILFADIVDFSSLAAALAPDALIEWLNGIFSGIDALARDFGIEKIKTIGDAYMAASGLGGETRQSTVAMADFALAIRALGKHTKRPDRTPLLFRIGMHCGPVTAGVIGTERYAYDLWGHTVNVASRLESSAAEGTIVVSDGVAQRLGDRFLLDSLGDRELKGVGSLAVHALRGARSL